MRTFEEVEHQISIVEDALFRCDYSTPEYGILYELRLALRWAAGIDRNLPPSEWTLVRMARGGCFAKAHESKER